VFPKALFSVLNFSSCRLHSKYSHLLYAHETQLVFSFHQPKFVLSIAHFHSVARWVVNEDVVQAAHGPAESTNSVVVPPLFQLTYGVKQHSVAMEE